MKKTICFLLSGVLAASVLAGCGSSSSSSSSTSSDSSSEAKTITIAYQSSVGYAPLIVMKDLGLLEENYDGDVEVVWTEMNNGSQINEGLTAGSIDIGSMGVPVAITGVMAGSPYRIAAGLSAQPYSILSNQSDINSLSDITSEDQIAITNINSQPHILLAMAAKAELGDAHALDNNLTVLGNADGYASMISGAVTCHMVISPYNFMEIESEDADIHEIEIGSDIWDPANTALVTVATNDLYEKNNDLYQAYVTALDQAMEYISSNPEEVAEMLAEGYDASAEEILEWISDSRSSYSTELHGVMEMSDFMVEEGFIENGPESISDIVYDGVKGE